MTTNNNKDVEHATIKSIESPRDYLLVVIMIIMQFGGLFLVWLYLALNGAMFEKDTQPYFLGLSLSLVVGIAVVISYSRKILKAYKLHKYGITTTGKIIDKSLKQIGKRPPSYDCHIIYQFNADIQIKQSVEEQDYKRVKVGDTVTVYYLADEPTCSRAKL